MSTIVKATLPAAEFALAETFERLPSVEFDAVRFVTHGSDRALPLVWGTNADAAELTAALEEDSTTTDVDPLSRRTGESLFRIDWISRVRFATRVLTDDTGAIVSAYGHGGEWRFRLLFPDRDAVSRTYDACRRHDVDVEITQIHQLSDSPPLRSLQLTDEQFRTVKTALERGYYQVPRETTLEELSEELGVSHQALSERLRRGHRTLVRDVLGPRIENEMLQ